jgi:myo-inositol-1(or 4)-monophosphatase
MSEMSTRLFLDAALEMAELASSLMLRFTADTHARRKLDGTLVTDLDHAVDQLLADELRRRFPDHRVLSEEGATVYDPAAAYTWIVDPLDGTTNFARGLSVWGVSVALVSGGVPLVGVLAFPLLRETYSAARGEGAFLQGHSIHTSAATSPDDTQLIMTCTRTARRFQVRTPLKTRIMGSAAYSIARVADGAALAAVEATPKLWDLAAALLILKEAGGVYAPLDEQPPTFPLPAIMYDYGSHSMPLLAAANADVLAALRPGITATLLL